MGKKIGSEALGKLYGGPKAKVFKRREWRGLKDTLYDYWRWLKVLGILSKFMMHPKNIKGFFRYRWMVNYLAVPMMIDKHSRGLRNEALRIFRMTYDLVTEDVAKLLTTIFKADRNLGARPEASKRIVLVDENEMTNIMCGFPNLKACSWETVSCYVCVLLIGDSTTHYLDVIQEMGLAGDVCPMPAAEAGICVDDDMPVFGACAVQCNTTCDGSLMGNGVISRAYDRLGIPVFQLATPLRHTEESVQDYAAQEIRNAIAFIEKHTLETFDWDYYFECAKRINIGARECSEWLEISKTDYPQVVGNNILLYRETEYMAIAGRVPEFEETDLKVTKLAREGFERKAMLAKEYRHRAVIWGVQAQFYTDFLAWLLNCWGIIPLFDMLTMVSLDPISEDNKEQAIYDMAHQYENMIMRNRTHGGYKVLLDDLWQYCEEFNADMVILWEHISCKALDGMHGLFEEQARERGIHLIWVNHDLFDSRVILRSNLRHDVNRYMRSVLREEPIDTSLEEIDDTNLW
ncbi:MAG: 2-hydroxyacyl-CoA dehydratase [Eggerthellaceae bacterium]|nr:2-hydroxyacyl-CoA dehydratase [Eggerthellaceae bacterium]